MHTIAKILSTSALAYAAYTVATCPCDKLIVCHVLPFYGAIVFGAVVPLINNALL
jgi:hypothetical protein